MGLAVVDGLVKKSKGAIQIKSPMEQGTSVEVLFPDIQEEKQAPSSRDDMAFSGKMKYPVKGETAWFRGLKGRDIPAQGNALGIGCKEG